MGFVSEFFKNREKKKLAAAVDSNRADEATYIRLTQVLQEEGDTTAAGRVIRKGISAFPRSGEIRRVYSHIARMLRDLEKERLRLKIESYPNPILYAKLADLYKRDGQVNASVQVCQAGIGKFPDYGGTYLVLGQICIERQDYEGALAQLERAVQLDRYNYTALKMLAEVYMRLERYADAALRLEEILYFAPGDETVTQLLEEARRQSGVVATAPTAPAQSGAEVPATQATQATQAAQPRRARAGTREDQLNDAIGGFREISGCWGALLVDPYGLVLASALEFELDEELGGALITNVYRTTSRATEQMEVGDFEDGLIEGTGGNIHIIGIDDMILAVFADKSARQGILEKTKREFIEHVKAVG